MRIPPLTPSAPSPGAHSKTVVIDCDTPETYPPWPCTTPLGLPVLPEVYDTKSGWSPRSRLARADLLRRLERVLVAQRAELCRPADATHRFAPHRARSTRGGGLGRSDLRRIHRRRLLRPSVPLLLRPFVRPPLPFVSLGRFASSPRLRASIADRKLAAQSTVCPRGPRARRRR